MAPSRKSRSVNKRFSSVHETASSKDKITENGSKNRLKASPGIQKKRRLADMLGPQWNKEELGHFYEAYRKYGKDWKKVALAVRNRSAEMVEALYTMNRAYLSLPEGTASVVGLIAMMTDHYSVLGGSDSGKESNDDAEISKKSQKRLRGKHPSDNKPLDGHLSDHSQSHSVASGDGCLSLLKKRHSGIRPHAVRKRTPRVPISYSIGKDIGERFFSSVRQGSKQMVDTNDVTHKIALALTEASQRGGSSKNSGSPEKKFLSSPGLKSGKKHSKSEKAGAKFCSSELDDGSSELSLGSTEGNNEDYSRKTIHRSGREITGRGRNQEKKIKQYGKNLEPEGNLNKHLNDIKEASSGTDDGKIFIKSSFNTDFVDAKNARSSYKGSRTKSKKLLLEKDEGSAFDALKTLADLSLMLPVTNPDTDMTSNKEQRQKLIALAKSRRAVGSSSETEATSEPISASPISVVPAEGPETRGEKKRKRLVKAPTTVVSVEEESSGSPLVQRRRRGAEGVEGDASPIPPAQVSPTRPPSRAHLPSPPPASQPLTLPSQTARSRAARSEGTSHPSSSPRPQASAATTEGGGESSHRASGSSTEGLTRVIQLTKQLLQNHRLIKWSGSEVDLHLAHQLVLSLEFSTQHRRIEKLEKKMGELHDQKESLQSDYEALQSANGLLRDMVKEAKRGHALQVQETIKTEMLMGDAVATLDAELVETTGKAIQLEAENAFLRQQIANLAEALAANERRANDQGSKLKEAESTIATLVTERVVLKTDKAELEAEKTKLWEEAADTFVEGFDLALEQVKCVFPEADCSQFAIDFEVVDGKIIRP